jgi:Tol biopolymer transport system component
MRPILIDAETGEITTIGPQSWLIVGRTVWLPGGRLLFSAMDRVNGPYQFWMADIAGKSARQITNDSYGFGNESVGVTADGSTIATVPWMITSNLFETNADASAPLVQWTSGVRDDGGTIAPLSEGRVYFDSSNGADTGVWSVDTPGGHRRRLTQDIGGGVSAPSDGRFVVMDAIADRQLSIKRVQPDGTGQVVLVSGLVSLGGRVSPDGRWLYYSSLEGLKRMPAEGGSATPIGSGIEYLLDISPDGRRLLVGRSVESASTSSFAIVDADSGAVLTVVDGEHDSVKWGRTPDVLAYLVRDDQGVDNLWERPVSGGTPRQLTRFSSGRTFNFAYSLDRKRLFLSRGTRTGDVTLIRGFR